MVTGSAPVVAVWVISLGSPSAFDAFDKIICFICCLSLLVFLCVFVKHPVMMKMTPCYPTDFTPGACFSMVSITETSKTQLMLFSYVPPVVYCHGCPCILCTFSCFSLGSGSSLANIALFFLDPLRTHIFSEAMVINSDSLSINSLNVLKSRL